MKKILCVVALVFAFALPVLAQGPFNDVPTDHWAYDAINKLQTDGILIGYPDGTFGGKRAITRYEFAVALARIPWGGTTGNFVTSDQLNSALSNYAKKSEIPDVSKFATKADVDAMRKLVDEFRDELAALGVDVDALKRDVCALAARVDAVEAEQRRVRFTGDVNVFAIATSARQGTVVDLDERTTSATGVGGAPAANTLARTLGVVKDFDLNIVGRVSCNTTANATINYGNYLNYVSAVDDYVDGPRPTTTGSFVNGGGSYNPDTLSDNFFPYFLYIDSALGKGNIQVGRFPIQFTPYTLKKIDVDSYTSILKTDDGNYPMDGAKLGYNFGGVDVTLFAAKNDTNDYLVNGLTGQPNSGLYDTANAKAFTFNTAGLTGRAVGFLFGPVAQTAGARIQAGTPWKGNIGATYYQSWSSADFFGGAAYDQARVYGFDLAIPFGNLGIAGSWNKSDTLAQQNSVAADITDNNTAWDAKLTAGFGKLGVGAGYKQIDRNYAAAGAWDKVGRWTNPTNVKGPYLDVTYPISSAVKVVLNGEYLKFIDTVNGGAHYFGQADDIIVSAKGGIQWGLSKTNSVDLGVNWVRFNPDRTGEYSATEAYYNIGWAHQFGSNAGLKIGYQFINYDDGNTSSGPYRGDYRGGLGVVQLGVSF